MIRLTKIDSPILGEVTLPISKSLFNRQLIINAISKTEITYSDINLPDDCKVLIEALKSNDSNINIGHAGTAMRFLSSYLTLMGKEISLSGSDRMHERPIGILVNALNQLGGDVKHIHENDCPPLLIKNSIPVGGKLSISGSVSSQYLSSLLLIAPRLKDGLQLKIEAPLVSEPYLDMTLKLMERNGIEYHRSGLQIDIQSQKYSASNEKIELDWSAASFLYELVALNPGSEIFLKGLSDHSLQGDAVLPKIYHKLGVTSDFTDAGIRIKNVTGKIEALNLDCNEFPDLALPIAATCAGLGIDCHLSGLETLLIKETNRIEALKIELEKFGVKVNITNSTLEFKGPELTQPKIPIETYNDHRMAMSMAPLVSVVKSLQIADEGVVSKSYPEFWSMLGQFVDIPK